MELTGTIIQVCDVERGTSKSGNAWQKRTVIVEYGDGQYPKKAAVTLIGERVDKYASLLNAGARLTFSIDINSREYNGRWYTEAIAWKVDVPQQQVPQQQVGQDPFGGFYPMPH